LEPAKILLAKLLFQEIEEGNISKILFLIVQCAFQGFDYADHWHLKTKEEAFEFGIISATMCISRI
jgi:hypothetical protein